jgi:hypothetical protein
MKACWRMSATSIMQLLPFCYQLRSCSSSTRRRFLRSATRLLLGGCCLGIHFATWSYSIDNTRSTRVPNLRILICSPTTPPPPPSASLTPFFLFLLLLSSSSFGQWSSASPLPLLFLLSPHPLQLHPPPHPLLLLSFLKMFVLPPAISSLLAISPPPPLSPRDARLYPRFHWHCPPSYCVRRNISLHIKQVLLFTRSHTTTPPPPCTSACFLTSID